MIPMSKKSGKGGGRLAWFTKDLLVKLKCKKKMHQRHVSLEGYRDTAWMCMDGMTKADVQLELNLARDAKNKKGFYRHIGQKRKIEENVPP